MFRHRAAAASLAALMLLALPVTSHAEWPRDPGNGGVVVCNSTNYQYDPVVVPDGAGGSIIVWSDYRTGTADIFAQRLSASGVPLWIANGVVVCNATASQSTPHMVADGSGGAIIVWDDLRNGTTDLYAQRINGSGISQWTFNGVAVATGTGSQSNSVIVADGAGGAVIGWLDTRAGNSDVYAQRLNSAGTALWGGNGLAVCTAVDQQTELAMCSDGAAGAYLVWTDARSSASTSTDIYGQHVLWTGGINWTGGGAAICALTYAQSSPTVVSDDGVGALVFWSDGRGQVSTDIYAQRISFSGSASFGSGLAVCTATGAQNTPVATTDGSGGAIVVWRDMRTDTYGDVYASRVTPAGGLPWTADGVAVSTAAFSQFPRVPTPDGSGGAVVLMTDYRDGNADAYAQRVSPSGFTQWTSNGVAVSVASDAQVTNTLSAQDDGSFVATWTDYRIGSISDIYAQRIDRYGKLGDAAPAITKVKDVPNDQGGLVKVSWNASYLDADPTYGIFEYRVFRSVPGSIPGLAAKRATTTDSDVAAATGALLVTPTSTTATAWEYLGTQAAEALDTYSRVCATTSDSIGGSNPRTYFMVEARSSTAASAQRWFSFPDSGYSVDNLGPAAPAPLTGQYFAGTTRLHWNRNTEADLDGYRIYRGASVAFTPSAANLVAAQADTGAVDVAGSPYVYKVTAVDIHGNESPVATLIPSGTLGVDGAVPPALSFAAPTPNPARGTTTLRFSLTQRGPVKLALYDAAGRRVSTIADGVMDAGAHSATLQLRDGAGHELPAGLYLARFEAEGRTITRRVVAVR